MMDGSTPPRRKYLLIGIAAAFVLAAYAAMTLRPGTQRADSGDQPRPGKGQPPGLITAARDTHLLGRWCGTESDYAITAKKMVVTRHSDSSQLTFDITVIEPREGRVSVSWRRPDGKVVRTEFTEFSADGLKMAQLSNSGGPRREFKRC